jgi:N-acetylmuramoyl-L-alanine amidase
MVNLISSTNNNKFMNSRPEGAIIDTVVITYSASEEICDTINALYGKGASVHYTIRPDGFQDQHHYEGLKAFYAGKSSWHNKTALNDNSIGIMLINDGKSEFTDLQINKLIDCINDINLRHDRKMEIVGLGEVALDRHIAPGKMFPWDKLSKAGLGVNVKISDNINRDCKLNFGDKGEKVSSFQNNLIKHGYGITETGQFDELTYKAVTVFVDRYVSGHDDCWSDATEYALNALLAVDN